MKSNMGIAAALATIWGGPLGPRTRPYTPGQVTRSSTRLRSFKRDTRGPGHPRASRKARRRRATGGH